jgi:TetR/AcrR family transcriptional repressor of lmrAB and yxaGH operons
MSANASSRSNGRASRKAFLNATGVLLRRQGYAGTGLSEIVERSGAPRGSLYFHFPGGKEELAVAAMERSGEQLRVAIATVMAAPGGPRAAVATLIDALAAGLEASGYRDGCPIATVTLETAGGGSVLLRETAARIFATWLEELETALRRDGLDAASAERRAVLVLAAIEGALLLARARHDTGPLAAVRDELALALA